MLRRLTLALSLTLAISISVSAQNAPPSVSLTSPAGNSTFNVPTDVVLTATASDSDGTVSKVEFFQGTASLGYKTSSPYQVTWTNVPAGNYVLTAKATDNAGATTISSPVNIVVNPMTISSGDGSCPSEPAAAVKDAVTFQFGGDSRTYPISLAPCELIEVSEIKVNSDPGSYTDVKLTYFNYQGQSIFSHVYLGTNQTPQTRYYFPSSFSDQVPWRGVRNPDWLPAYLRFETYGAYFNGDGSKPPTYEISITRSIRPGYNKGGYDFTTAQDTQSTVAAFPKSYYGSLRTEEPNGQMFKVTLQPLQQFHVAGYFRGHQTYTPFNVVELYDANYQKIPADPNLHWAYGGGSYSTFNTSFRINNSSTNSVDYYVQVRCANNNVYDFRIDFTAVSCPPLPGSGSPAPDATGTGPLATAPLAEYNLQPAAVDPDILADDGKVAGLVADPNGHITGRETELWARVFRPSSLSAGPYPLIIMLHGNHPTCGINSTTGGPRDDTTPSQNIHYNNYYTTTGTCPDGQVAVPSYWGYDYLGQQLASRGFIVVSINANRGITYAPETIDGVDYFPSGDPGYNLARARLVLKHLQKLSEWNQNGGTPASLGVELQNKIDFGNVGLMGHSRGGEAVRIAHNLYNLGDAEAQKWHTQILSQLTIKAIFEVAPTDAGTTDASGDIITNWNSSGTKWNVLLPMCDGDLFYLEGIRPFDRMLHMPGSPPEASNSQKSTFAVWGANHNYYNTQWQQSDSDGCTGIGNVALFSLAPDTKGSASEQQTGLASVLAFFRANLGSTADANFNKNFNPLNSTPTVINSVTRVDRGFTISPASSSNTSIEDFNEPVGTDLCTTSAACSSASASVGTINNTSIPEIMFDDPSVHVALVSWTTAGPGTTLQLNVGAGTSLDASPYQFLDLRVSRQPNNDMNRDDSTNFSLQLVNANGSSSTKIPLCNYIDLRGPVGGFLPVTQGAPIADPRPILQSVHIPLSVFTGIDLTHLAGVRFVYDKTTRGAIFLTNVRLTK